MADEFELSDLEELEVDALLNEVVGDGEVLRVPLVLMDDRAPGGERVVPRMVDAFGRSEACGHRAGFTFAVRTEAEQGAYEDMLARERNLLADAWKQRPPARDAVPTFTRGKRAMELEKQNLRFQQGAATPDEVYELHKRKLSEMWKRP
jgi:hypothetical protein